MFSAVAARYPLVASRAPSLIIFVGAQTALWTWVASRTNVESVVKNAPPSHIPKGYIGKARFQSPQLAHAS
ncbi:uncharacterized protein LAESUDRAFT_723408 [Laetiporus sulphureus 93-53]|uniref:Uncharacterized protein n=1 Tax=Laetiporus sulphureus 93-53 TaxID=1314785 RepID=A0A165F7H8_9APHY|nr:uncharacterized protein LAESUDRAFT_723408 [Laetiporus sulphureus 93-53]KZT08540.1 hypothetical protein LAESUDRAFT_723408 [Laetiporus sulphureus 93-53]